MARVVEQLLNSLTQIFRRDPAATSGAALAISIESVVEPAFQPGAFQPDVFQATVPQATVTLDNHTLTILSPNPLVYDVRHWTLERLVEHISAQPGLTASMLDARFNKVLGSALIDGVDQPLPVSLSVATNALWSLLKPIALAIEDHEESIDTALAQLNILTAQKFFADFWGTFIGVVRTAGESDVDYTQRIVDTILLRRANDVALEQIIFDTFGLDATAEDLWPLVLNINNAICFSKIPGEVYNSGNFLVTTLLTADDVLALVEKHRAAGTKVFLRRIIETQLGEDIDVLTSDFYSVSIFDMMMLPEQEIGISAQIGSGEIIQFDIGLPEWIVGVAPMPGSKIA